MTIKTINIGTNPNDNTGEGLRDGLKKVNDNFTDSANAASKIMATNQQALDGTAGVVPDAEQVHEAFGQYGLGVESKLFYGDLQALSSTRVVYQNPAFATINAMGTQAGVVVHFHGPSGFQLYGKDDKLLLRGFTGNNFAPLREILHSGNTTEDSNGFIKSASPIINLFDDKIEGNATDGVTLEKTGTGVYTLNGVTPLAESGWYIETPKDRNGNIYFTLDYEQDLTARTLTIRTYEPDYSTGPATNGTPVDINPGRFVALRFNEKPEEPELPDPGETEEE